MPIYEYQCTACTHEFEALVRSGSVVKCEKCGSDRLEKRFSLPAIQSETTHAMAMRAARTRDRKQGAEREHTQREYEKHHDD